MIALRRILVPTDFSEASNNALRYAKEFASQFGAALHLLHVIDDSQIYMPATFDGAVPPPASLRDELASVANAKLAQLLTDEERQRLAAELVLHFGSPFVEIVRYAKKHEIDMIVQGTHGRGAIVHMLMGSVAERVVRKAPCPVLSVRQTEHEFVMP